LVADQTEVTMTISPLGGEKVSWHESVLGQTPPAGLPDIGAGLERRHQVDFASFSAHSFCRARIVACASGPGVGG